MPLSFTGPIAEFVRDETPEIDLEGSRYSGKTWACSAKVIEACLKYPGMEWLACRYADEETQTYLRPEFEQIARKYYGLDLEWSAQDKAFLFPALNGEQSKVAMHGLKTQDKLRELAKVRGLDKHAVWVDQAEELPQASSEELRFATRKPGAPHQLIFSPNPPDENHYLTDQFPDDNPQPHRKYYRVSLYDNPHCPIKKRQELEQMYPPTHAKYKSLVLGQRGVNVIGKAVYEHMFDGARNIKPLAYDETRPLYEAFQYGQHHPAWIVAQRTYRGGLSILAGALGKRLFLDDFVPFVLQLRRDWFGDDANIKTCCDPPPEIGSARFTSLTTLKDCGLSPTWSPNSNAADVREAVIQDLAAMWRRDDRTGLRVSADASRFLAASRGVLPHLPGLTFGTKRSTFFTDGLESSYVWDEHMISVGNKKVRQPKADEWTDGAQRCLENIWLNFCASKISDYEKDRRKEAAAEQPQYRRPSVWA